MEGDLVHSIIDIVVCGTGDGNQVLGHPYTLDIHYDRVGLFPMDILAGDSM